MKQVKLLSFKGILWALKGATSKYEKLIICDSFSAVNYNTLFKYIQFVMNLLRLGHVKIVLIAY